MGYRDAQSLPRREAYNSDASLRAHPPTRPRRQRGRLTIRHGSQADDSTDDAAGESPPRRRPAHPLVNSRPPVRRTLPAPSLIRAPTAEGQPDLFARQTGFATAACLAPWGRQRRRDNGYVAVVDEEDGRAEIFGEAGSSFVSTRGQSGTGWMVWLVAMAAEAQLGSTSAASGARMPVPPPPLLPPLPPTTARFGLPIDRLTLAAYVNIAQDRMLFHAGGLCEYRTRPNAVRPASPLCFTDVAEGQSLKPPVPSRGGTYRKCVYNNINKFVLYEWRNKLSKMAPILMAY